MAHISPDVGPSALFPNWLFGIKANLNLCRHRHCKRFAHSTPASSYSGLAAERKHGNITTTMNIKATIASCIVSGPLSKVNEFTSPSNISRPVSAAHPTEAGWATTLVLVGSARQLCASAIGQAGCYLLRCQPGQQRPQQYVQHWNEEQVEDRRHQHAANHRRTHRVTPKRAGAGREVKG